MKLCIKNYENPSIFVKVTAKKQWHLFSGHGVYSIATGDVAGIDAGGRNRHSDN